MTSTKDLEFALAHGKQTMDDYLELRNGDEIIAEIKALVDRSKNCESIRDMFAAKAMLGILIVHSRPELSMPSKSLIAEESYKLADAMLKSRTEPK